ncbi:hypothetical protein EBZ39_00460 [bacterium]|nr:hypothetical protein [bacterium]
MSSEQEPVAWAVQVDGVFRKMVQFTLHDAEFHANLNPPGVVVPLYRHPQSVLTPFERGAIQRAIDAFHRIAGDAENPRGWIAIQAEDDANALRGILKKFGGAECTS